MAQKDKLCPSCGRIFEPVDWSEPDCPFCGVPLMEEGGPVNILSDVISTGLDWPAGQLRKKISVVSGYLSAQLIKAQLESSGIPVLLNWDSVGNLYPGFVGRTSEVTIFVPENMAELASKIIQGEDTNR